MKFVRTHIRQWILFLVFAMAFTHSGFAFSIEDKEDSFEFSVKEDGGEMPLEINRFSLTKTSPSISSQEHVSAGFIPVEEAPKASIYSKVFTQLSYSEVVKDHRAFIYRYIYPFHFFW